MYKINDFNYFLTDVNFGVISMSGDISFCSTFIVRIGASLSHTFPGNYDNSTLMADV
jgi:hypothetical protein